MDEATIVSYVPFPIYEWKPGIYPSVYDIQPSVNNKPQLLSVGVAFFWVNTDPDNDRSIKIKVPAEDVARAVVEDYLVSNLEYRPEDGIMPALFWVPGSVVETELNNRYKNLIDKALKGQHEWFLKLVKLADDDWERSHQHRAVTDTQRYAAKSLNLEREWIIVPKTEGGGQFRRCLACTSMVPVEAIVCSVCKCVLDKEKYDKLTFMKS